MRRSRPSAVVSRRLHQPTRPWRGFHAYPVTHPNLINRNVGELEARPKEARVFISGSAGTARSLRSTQARSFARVMSSRS